MLKYVGKSIIRDDITDRAKGLTKYICDMELHGMLYAKLLLSEKPHANVVINKEAALKIPGVRAVFTFEDVPKKKFNSHTWYAGIEVYKDEYIINEKARFVGDKLALVVGETMEAVQRGLNAVEVIYEELPAVLSMETAKEDKLRVQECSNLAFEKRLSCGDYEEAFKNAKYIIEDTGTTPRMHHAAIEPHICLSTIDEKGNLVVWTPCQSVMQGQTVIAEALDIPYNKIRVIKANMGGSFGGKSHSILEPVCAFATHKLKCPVKLVMDRKDAILATRTRNFTKMNVKTAVDTNGKILGREITTEIDGGAYYTNAAAIVMSMGKKAFRLYDIENQSFYAKSYYTNTLLGGPCRGYGSPQIHAITEINMDNVAKKLDMDPCDFRMKNLVKSGAKDPIGGPDLGNAKIIECIEKGMAEFDWKNRRMKVAKKNTERFAYGLGMACGVHGNGYKGAYPDFTDVIVTIYPDGSILFSVSAHEQGCGTIMTLKQIAAESLDVSIEKIEVTEADTFLTPYDSAGTQASRVTFVVGGAIKHAGEKMKEKILNSISKIKNIDVEKIKYDNGIVCVDGTNENYTLGQIALMVENELRESLTQYVRYESPANPGSYAACFTEVEVDKFTGHVEIKDFLAVHDVGKSINPILVEGQIEGGAHFSLGMALREEIIVDNKGNVKSQNFSKYHVINAPEMPEIKIITIEDIEPMGPYGAKSVGEMATVVPAPAVLNAINHALNTNITRYPATPEVIVENISKLDNGIAD